MRLLATLFTLAATICGGCVDAHPFTDAQYEYLFTKWMTQHNKVYPQDQFFTKFHTFKSNLDKIHHHNQGNFSFTMAMNQFGDMTSEQFKQTMLGFRGHSRMHGGVTHTHMHQQDVPKSIDWRAKGAVTPVINQGQCGSAWALSTTGSVEGAVFIASNVLIPLSAQQLMDCTSSNQGCSGGLMDNGFKWIIENKGITSQQQYPYMGVSGVCQTNVTSVATITGYVDVPSLDEHALLLAVAQQPVSIAIEADQPAFQFYEAGVIDDPSCGTTLDHSVLIVGYGTDQSGKDYWIVKNSWGAAWGEQGYVRLVRNKNECGLAQQASYPTGARLLKSNNEY